MTDDSFLLYPHRWSVLVSFSILTMTSSWMWITWSPIAMEVAQMWEVAEGDVDALSGVYMYVYVPGSFVSLWLVVNRLGLRRGLLVGATLNAIGSFVRYAGMWHYKYVYIGTFLCATAQTFTLSTPPLIAGTWFGANERGTATALGVLANQFGTAMGLGATMILNFSVSDEDHMIDPHKLRTYLGAQLVMANVALLMIVNFITADKPQTPPSAAAAMYTNFDPVGTQIHEETQLLNDIKRGEQAPRIPSQMAYFASVKSGLQNSLTFVLVFGLAVGVYYTIPTFLSQLVPAWSPRKSGWLGVVYQLSGVVGSFVSGRVVDVFQHHWLTCLILLTGALFSTVCFSIALALNQQSWWITLSVYGIGFCLAALNTVGLELGTAMTYPADEAAVAGLLECAAELGAFFLVTIGGRVTHVGQYFVWVLGTTIALALLVLICSRAESKRPR